MKLFAAVVMVLVMCVMGWGQAFTSPTGPLMNVDCSKGQPICPQGHSCQCAPLKCEKYEHEQKIAAHCENTCPSDAMVCTSECRYVAEDDRCVPNLHTLTEKDWQDLMARLKALEHKGK